MTDGPGGIDPFAMPDMTPPAPARPSAELGRLGPGAAPPFPDPFATGPGRPDSPLSGLAVASLVLSVLWLFWLGSLAAVVVGHLALRRVRERGESGREIAVIGLVLGYLGLGLLLLFVGLVAVAVGSGPEA